MYLPSCTYYVSNPARQADLRSVNPPFLGDPVPAACSRDTVQGLRDYGSTWLDNSSVKLPDYRHYCYEPRQQYRHQTGKWSVYHQTNHHHHHHHPSPSYFSPEETVFRDPADGVFNNNNERFVGYDHAGMLYGGHGAASRYHTSTFGDGNAAGSAARAFTPGGLPGSKTPSGTVPSAGRNGILPAGFDAFIEAAEEHEEQEKIQCSPEGPETPGADRKDTHPGEEMCDKKTEPSEPLRAGLQGQDSPSSNGTNEDNTKEPSMCCIYFYMSCGPHVLLLYRRRRNRGYVHKW